MIYEKQRRILPFSLLHICFNFTTYAGEADIFYKTSYPGFAYMGRGDFSDAAHPKFWASGAQIIFAFTGDSYIINLTDENLWGKDLNYIQLIMDGKYSRFKLKEMVNKLSIPNLSERKTYRYYMQNHRSQYRLHPIRRSELL